MLTWLASNWGTILVVLILAAAVFLAVRALRKDKKQGKSSCGGNCGHCPMGGTCGRQSTDGR